MMVLDNTLNDFGPFHAQGVGDEDILHRHQLRQIRRPELPLRWSGRLGQKAVLPAGGANIGHVCSAKPR